MNEKQRQSSIARRSFLARLGAGIGVAGAAVVAAPVAAAKTVGHTPWRPIRHAQDEWLDQIPGQHRFVFDITTADGMGLALQFADNYFKANQQGYGLSDSDLAVVIVARHRSTPFGYDDAIWAKYGKQFSEQAEFTDPAANEPYLSRLDFVLEHLIAHVNLRNVYAAPSDGPGKAGRLNDLIRKGVHFAVCQTATRGISATIAHATGGEADTIFQEIAANLIPNARLVPAGIVAVNRAQERGYSYVYTA